MKDEISIPNAKPFMKFVSTYIELDSHSDADSDPYTQRNAHVDAKIPT